MNEFLQLTDSQTGEPVFIAPNEIKSIHQLQADSNYGRRTVINGAITVKEEATLIALATGRGFIGKEDTEKLYNQQTNSSIILQSLSLTNPEVLNKPEEFLGPNYKEVFKFWNKIEKMTEEQLKVVNKRYFALLKENSLKWDKAVDLAVKASKKAVGFNYASDAGFAAWEVINSYAAIWVTKELIGGVENPVFLEMFDNL